MVSNRRPVSLLFVVLVLVIGSSAAACGGSGDDDGDSDGASDSANEDASGSDGGEVDAQQIFIDTGCAECHGENGEGDGANPQTALAGNQLFVLGQFQQRVRNGRGSDMPAYTEEQISDEQIELIFEWLVGQ